VTVASDAAGRTARPHTVAVIPGDGIGPDVIAATQRVMEATGVPLRWRPVPLGAPAVEQAGDPVPRATVEAIRRCGVALKGPVATPQDGSMASPNVGLRRALGLRFQVRTVRSFGAGAPPVDVLIIRETTEDLYAGVGFDVDSAQAAEVRRLCGDAGMSLPADCGVSVKYLSVSACEAVWRFAVEAAGRAGRPTLTAAHKTAVMPHTDGLFVRAGRRIVTDAGLGFEAVAVDTLAARLVSRPASVGVIVAPNLYGDVLADLAGALAGGVGVVAGANHGDGALAVFEAAHGAAWRHAGRGTANPVGAILSGAMALRHLGEPAAADAIVRAVMAAGERHTRGGPGNPPVVRTAEVTSAVIAALDRPATGF
jgi:isocitrate dehydrogenase (NAD+)